MQLNHEFGKKAEQVAIKYLQNKNIQIITHNYRYKKLEIDIIAIEEGTLIFIEVKGRSNQKFAYPENHVNIKKQTSICKAAMDYITKTNWEGPIRFDVISIVANKDEQIINHFEDAFYYIPENI